MRSDLHDICAKISGNCIVSSCLFFLGSPKSSANALRFAAVSLRPYYEQKPYPIHSHSLQHSVLLSNKNQIAMTGTCSTNREDSSLRKESKTQNELGFRSMISQVKKVECLSQQNVKLREVQLQTYPHRQTLKNEKSFLLTPNNHHKALRALNCSSYKYTLAQILSSLCQSPLSCFYNFF